MARRKTYQHPRALRLILAEFIAKRCGLSTTEKDLGAICCSPIKDLLSYVEKAPGSATQKKRTLYAIQFLTETTSDVKTNHKGKTRREG